MEQMLLTPQEIRQVIDEVPYTKRPQWDNYEELIAKAQLKKVIVDTLKPRTEINIFGSCVTVWTLEDWQDLFKEAGLEG